MKQLIYILLPIAFILVLRTVLMAKNTGSAEEIAELRDKNALIIDVRTTGEFSGDHIDNAINIPLSSLADIRHHATSKSTPIILYCHSGARAASAHGKLQKMGYEKVTNCGGINRARHLLTPPSE